MKCLAILSFLIVFILFLPSTVLAADASLNLSPAIGTYTIGSTFDISILVNPGSASVSGADANIAYDSTKLEVVSITAGSTLWDLALKEANPATNTIRITGLVPLSTEAFTTQQTLAIIKFKALSLGSTQVTFNFQPSNVADQTTQSDVLATVTNGNYTISGGSDNGTSGNNGNSGSRGGNTSPSRAPARLPVTAGMSSFPYMGIGFGAMLILTSFIILKGKSYEP